MEDILIPLAGMATAIILLYPIIRVGVRFVEGKMQTESSGDIAALRQELRSVHDRLDSVETDGHRLSELEERLDFAERILARKRESRQLGSGG